MRLAAIYIKKHNYLFDKPQTINLGGKFFYELKPNEKDQILITKTENQNFIDGFWGNNISLVSAIVGENGTGKTSILKELMISRDRFHDKTLFNNIALIYEVSDKDFKVVTKLELIDESLKEDVNNRIEYYNPVLDYDQQDISSYINPSNIFDGTLEEYHLTILEYQILFNYSDVSSNLKQLYKDDFPKFGSVLLKGKLHYKDDFLKKYAITNLQEGMIDYLKEVFNKYPNHNKDNSPFIHNQNNFIKDVEAIILAIIVINNVYPIRSETGNSKYSIQKILEGNNFLAILEKFKEQYIALNSTREMFKKYEKKDIEEFTDYLIKDIYYDPLSKDILRILMMFDAFENFYNELLKISSKNGFTIHDNNLIFSNSKNEKEINNNMIYFINLYRKLLAELNSLDVKNPSLIEFSFFELSNNKRHILSNGEKALLNLYSIVFNFTLKSQIKTHNWKNFIFLLDEADLGFHPEWKKRFINSIVNVFPEILAEIYYLDSIQIIFTTHDPLTLSDIPNSNVVYLKKKDLKTDVLKNEERPQKSFGANITDLLSDSFFINDGLIGDFAKEKIQITLEWLKIEANKRDKLFALNDKIIIPKFESKIDEIDYHKKIIGLIDEPLVKGKLKDIFIEFVSEDLEFKNEEILLLEKRLNKLKT